MFSNRHEHIMSLAVFKAIDPVKLRGEIRRNIWKRRRKTGRKSMRERNQVWYAVR